MLLATLILYLFKNFSRFVQDLSKLCSRIFRKNQYGLFKFFKLHSRIVQASFQVFFQFCSRNFKICSRIFKVFLQAFFQSNFRFIQALFQICSNFAQAFFKFCSRLFQTFNFKLRFNVNGIVFGLYVPKSVGNRCD